MTVIPPPPKPLAIAPSGTLRAAFPGCPSALDMPAGYELENGALYRVWGGENAGKALVSRAPIVVVGQTRDADSGLVSSVVAWPVPGRKGQWRTVSVPRHHALSARKVVDLAEHGAPVSSGEAAEVVRWLACLDALVPEQAVSTSRLGWHGAEWVSGAWSTPGAPSWRETGGGVDLVRRAIRVQGDERTWINETREILLAHPYARVAVAAAVAPVLLDWAGGHGFVVEFAAPTGQGKSTMLRLGASVWGASQEGAYMRTWDDTRVYLSAVASAMHHHPLIVDETKRAAGDWGKIRDMIYALHSGTDRGRGKVDGSAQASRAYRSVMITSGETPITSALPDGGIRGRVLSLTGPPLPDARWADRVNRLTEDHFGHLGAWVARAAAEATDETRAETRALARQTADNLLLVYRQPHPTAARLAAYGGVLAAAGSFVADYLGVPSESGWWVDDRVWRSVLAATADADVAQTTHDSITSWALSSGRLYEPGARHVPTGGWVGCQDGTVLFLLPAEVRQYCQARGLDYGEWMATGRERRWVEQVVKKFAGAAHRTLRVTPTRHENALPEPEPDADDCPY